VKKYLILAVATLFAVAGHAGTCFAFDAAGKYTYAEKGYSGTMTIKRMGPGFVFKFKTTDKSTGQMCDFETYETPIDQGGGRVNDELPAKGGTKDDNIKFTISFSGNAAIVDVESTGAECGRSGYFGGKYIKATK
jgi:hypothetical protein